MFGLGTKTAYLSIAKKSLLSFQAEKRDGLWTIRNLVKGEFDANAALSDQKAALTAHLRSSCQGLTRLNISMPDSFARVALQDYGELPRKDQEARDIILWRAAREAFTGPEECRADHQVLSTSGGVRVLAVLSKKELICALEEGAKDAGINIARMNIHSLNLVNLLSQLPHVKDNAALITVLGGSISIMFFKSGVLDFYRHLVMENGFERASSELASTLKHYKGGNREVDLEAVYVLSDDDAVYGAAASVFIDNRPELIRPEDLIKDTIAIGGLSDKMLLMSALGSPL